MPQKISGANKKKQARKDHACFCSPQTTDHTYELERIWLRKLEGRKGKISKKIATAPLKLQKCPFRQIAPKLLEGQALISPWTFGGSWYPPPPHIRPFLWGFSTKEKMSDLKSQWIKWSSNIPQQSSSVQSWIRKVLENDPGNYRASSGAHQIRVHRSYWPPDKENMVWLWNQSKDAILVTLWIECVGITLNATLLNCSEKYTVMNFHIKDFQKIFSFMKDMKQLRVYQSKPLEVRLF